MCQVVQKLRQILPALFLKTGGGLEKQPQPFLALPAVLHGGTDPVQAGRVQDLFQQHRQGVQPGPKLEFFQLL